MKAVKIAVIVIGMIGLNVVTGMALFSVPARAEQPALSADQASLVADFNGMAGSLQASSTAFDHMKAELKAVIEAQQKETAELVYWRQYFSGLPAVPAPAKAPEVKQLPASVAPK